ncbi:MAG: cold-shock protein [Mucilaginibacter sp.]|jgi:cold shock CspA family protein
MGRSNETFNKKEKEKKRLKKQQDKKQKAEDRKSNSSKGKSLEDMMAYIDADGNITSTPPVAGQRRETNAADIQIGVPKQEALPPEVRKGMVSMFNEQKGFGFIRDQDSRESIFVHASGLTVPIRENDKVTFETAQGQKGLTAVNVKKI